MKQNIEPFGIDRVQTIFSSYKERHKVRPYFSKDLSILLGGKPSMIMDKVLQQGVPYRIENARIGLLRAGEADISLNLRDYHIIAGTALFATDGSILQINRFSQDAELTGLTISPEFLHQALGAQQPAVFSERTKGYYISLEAHDMQRIEGLFNIIYDFAWQGTAMRAACAKMVGALLLFYDALLRHPEAANLPPKAEQNSRALSVYDRFLNLVTTHCTKERTLDFYARELCLTPRYLSTLVAAASGKTAKEWIERGVLEEAKVMLRHTDLSVQAITYRLHFPNPSFFCKFFRRLTGQTPLQYKRQNPVASPG